MTISHVHKDRGIQEVGGGKKGKSMRQKEIETECFQLPWVLAVYWSSGEQSWGGSLYNLQRPGT